MNTFDKLARRYNWSCDKSQRVKKKIQLLIDSIEKDLRDDPFNTLVEDLTDKDILLIRNMFCEEGIELIPQELRDAIEIIKMIRGMVR